VTYEKSGVLTRLPISAGEDTGGPGKDGFSLIEIMVTVALLSLIILGLLSMFNQVQRAFRSSMTQVDVLEAGRAVTDLLVRDMEGIYPTKFGYNTNAIPWSTNFFAISNGVIPLTQYLPGTSGPNGPFRTNYLQTVFFMTRVNQSYIGNGYFVYPDSPEGSVGTLYRYQFATNKLNAAWLSTYFAQSLQYIMQNGPTNMPSFISRIADGVVAFNVKPFETNGIEVTSTTAQWDGLTHLAIPVRDFIQNISTNVPIPNAYAQILPDNRLNYYYLSNAVPAALELEVGFVEPRIRDRYVGMGGPPPIAAVLQGAQRSYLSNHVSEVHLFRQRIPIRNVDYTAYK